MPSEPDSSAEKTIHAEIAREITQILIHWGQDNFQDFPWRKPEQLWHGLIAEVLLQRTKARNVVPVYLNFIAQFPTPSHIEQADVKEIESIIYPLGLRWRAPLIKKLGRSLMQSGIDIPKEIEGLKTLPGVGDYAASAWLSFHGGVRSVIIDANIVRFICRLTNNQMDGETRRKKWVRQIAVDLTPESNWKEYNYAILDFTMLICKTKPECGNCPVGSQYCSYKKLNYETSL